MTTNRVGTNSGPSTRPRDLGGGRNRLLGGYGPLLGMIATFLVVTTLVPTIAPEAITTVPGSGGTGPATTGLPGAVGPAGSDPAGGGAAAPTGGTGAGAVPGGTTSACGDRTQQVPGDPYSPPCIAFSGDNGGATSRGVTADTIRVSFRMPVENISDFQGVISELAGGAADDIPVPTEADVRRTIDGLLEYFSRNFQFYGRRIEVVEWKGQGSAVNEILGAGQEAANADAIRAATELEVFADISAFTQPYSDALARQHVVAVGAPYVSREWFQARSPYTYSPFPDCTSLGEQLAGWANARLFPYPASLADGALAGQPRKVGVVAPDNPEYQQCVDAAQRIVEQAGNTIQRYSYTLDLSTASDQANSLAARLRSDGITTIVLASDPLVPLLLASRMTQQDYFPEWVVTGTALTDVDLVGQLYDKRQWANAFGISLLGEQQPAGSSYAYFAFKSVYPDAEPIIGVELLYYYFYMLALSVQMAGPNLTPETLEAGLRNYPGATGPAGTWAFPPGEFTPYRDAREIRWDPDGLSVYNGRPGRYVSDNARHRGGDWPAGDAATGG